jgi:hypothetical protein
MDFEKLLEKYSERGERTVGRQLLWLGKQGFPQESIDFALSAVYKRLEEGEVFLSGHLLDQEIRRVTVNHQCKALEEQMKERIKGIEDNLEFQWNQLSKMKKIIEVIRGRA